ncbi:MAG: putative toxin-antitoxin system toxin component, PIN family [Acidobacteriaceae bacterium]
MIERVVFDTSPLVSAVIRPESIPWQALRRAFLSGEVCASAQTLAEMEEVLERSRFDRYLDRPTRRAAAEQVRRDCRMFVMDRVDASPPCRDSRDNKFLALALIANADAIVSSDEDLLTLHPWRGIPILAPTQFLAEYE